MPVPVPVLPGIAVRHGQSIVFVGVGSTRHEG
jgi:hypothetical protein